MCWGGSRFLQKGVQLKGGRGHPPPENFGIFSPRICIFRHSGAKSACFNVSFSKVKIPLFSH